MHVACPSCSATYEVPEAVLSAGTRRLRCARCAHEWVPQVAQTASKMVSVSTFSFTPEPPSPPPPAASPPQPPPPVAAVEPPPPSAAAAKHPTESLMAANPLVAPSIRAAVAPLPASARSWPPLAVVVGWALTVLVLSGSLVAGYVYRDRVQATWPPSQRLYAALGLPKTAQR